MQKGGGAHCQVWHAHALWEAPVGTAVGVLGPCLPGFCGSDA